jgi:hypothetical protein
LYCILKKIALILYCALKKVHQKAGPHKSAKRWQKGGKRRQKGGKKATRKVGKKFTPEPVLLLS